MRTTSCSPSDGHGPRADGPVGGLAQRAVQQVERAAEHELVEVERADDRGQRGAELLARGGEHVGRGRRGGEPAAQVGYGEQGLEAAGAAAGAVARRRGRPRRGRSRRRRRGGRGGARPRGPGRHRHRSRSGAPSGRRRRRRRRCARRARRCWRRWRRRPGGRAARCEAAGERGVGPAEVGSVDDGALGVDDAGAADADAEDRAVGQRDQRGGELGAPARRRRRPWRPATATSWRAMTVPARLSTAPSIRSSGERSMLTMWAESAARPTSVGGLPTRLPAGRAELLDEALGHQLADQVGDGDPGQAGGPGQVGAAGRARAGTAAGAAARGGGGGRPPGAACRGGGAVDRPVRVVVTFVSSAHLHIIRQAFPSSPDLSRTSCASAGYDARLTVGARRPARRAPPTPFGRGRDPTLQRHRHRRRWTRQPTTIAPM